MAVTKGALVKLEYYHLNIHSIPISGNATPNTALNSGANRRSGEHARILPVYCHQTEGLNVIYYFGTANC